MSQSATPTTTPAGGSTSTATASGSTPASTRVAQSYGATFSIPSGVKLPQFDGTGYAEWAGTFEALLTIQEAEDHLTTDTAPADADQDEWDALERRLKAYLRLYMTAGVYSQISDEASFPNLKDKWDQLKKLYSGASGSTTVFNDWIALTQAKLDENLPMGPQLTKLNEACVNLANAKMGVSDTQYCFIILALSPTLMRS